MIRTTLLAISALALGATAQDAPSPAGPLDRLLADVHPEVARWATAIRIESPGDAPRFTTFHLGDSATANDFWPASTIKLYTVVAVLEWLGEHELPLESTLVFSRRGADGAWIQDCARTVPEMVSEVFRRSSNEDYTLLLRAVGIDWINTRFLIPEKGFERTALMRDYVTWRPVLYENDEPQRVVVLPAAGEPRTFEHTWSGVSYSKAVGATVLSETTANCTTTAELAECLRRIAFHRHLPESERYTITDDQARWILEGDPERGVVGLENREAGDYGWTGAGAEVFPDARYFHKAGWISSYSLDLCYLSDAESDRHVILALAAKTGEEQVIRDMAKRIYEALRDDTLR